MMTKDTVCRPTIRIPASFEKQIRDIAKARKTARNKIYTEAIRKYLESLKSSM